MKAVAIGLLALCILAFGWAKSTTLKRRAVLLESAEILCRRVGEELFYSASPPPELLARLSQSSALRELTFLTKFQSVTPAEFHTVWRREIAAFSAENGLDKEASALLSDFGEGLGTTDLQGQKAHCEAYAARFSRQKDEADVAYAEKGRLYVSLGGIGAAAVALILI